MWKFHPHIHYTSGYMISPNQGSDLLQNIVINRWPRENWYISGNEGPNEILQDVLYREWSLVFVINVSDPEGETVPCRSPYKFDMLNSPEISHLGKLCISPNWWNQLCSNLWCWKEEKHGYLSAKFQIQTSSNFRDTIETISGNSVEEIEEN